jgi:hypothetical protein
VIMAITSDPQDPDLKVTDETGMQKSYLVLSDEERSKGFVRPVRLRYAHITCGGITTMNLAIAETYARDPHFYGGTYCATCREHFPVGPEGQFVWEPDGTLVGT